MPVSSSMQRRSQAGAIRKRTALAAAGLLVAALVPTIAFANLTGSTFESTDGNLSVDTAGNHDWSNAPNRQAGVEQFSGSADNSFGQGTKEDDTTPTVVTGSIPPNKSDLTRFYVANDTGSNGHKYLYLAWERTNTLGSANMDFEINQAAQPDMTTTGTKDLADSRTSGDLLVRYDFGGSGAPVLSLVKWLKGGAVADGGDGATSADCNANNALPCWGALPADDGLDGTSDNQIDLSASSFADGSVNQPTCTGRKCVATTPEPIAGIDLPPATFGEAAIDLTAAGVFPAGQCRNFGSAYLKSRSSDSFTAETKDFIAPISISINNCGNLTIKKVTLGGTGTFGFTSNTLADQTSGDNTTTFTLTTTGVGTANAASTGSTYHGILAGTYDAAENAKTGWTLTSATCDNGDDPSAIHVTVGSDITCTFTNTAKATIRFAKVTNPNTDTTTDFTFDPSDTLQTGTFTLKNGGTKSYVDVVPGTYQAVESDPTPAYDLTGRACVLTGTSTAHTATTTAARTISVDLAAGEDVTCTFTNTKRGSLTITKNDDVSPTPNTLDGVVFTLFTDAAPVGGTPPHGVEDTATTLTCTTVAGTCSISNIPLGDYWIVETTGKTGYALAADQHLTVTAGSSATKTFVDPRQFHVITLVCQDSDNSLHPSSVTLDGSTKTSMSASDLAAFNAANGTSLTEAQVCALTGARFGPKQTGTYSGSVGIQ